MNTQLVIDLGSGSGNGTVAQEHVDAAVHLGVPIENPADPVSTQAYIVAYFHYLVCQREKLSLTLLAQHIKPAVGEMWQEVLSYLEDRRRRVVDVQSGSLVFTLFCPTQEASDQLRNDLWREELRERLLALVRFLGTYETRFQESFVSNCDRQQWRIQDFPQVGAPTLGGGGGANIRFCQNFPKLHEIERIWTPGASKILLCRSVTGPKRSVGVTPEVNLRIPLHTGDEAFKQEDPLALETQARHH